jgi:serine/threonine-protein kinase
LLSGRYRLDEPIATGGMGQVWRATDMALRRVVAVKVLHPSLLTDPGFDARFRAEARILAALTHPHVVSIYDYGHSQVAGRASVAYLVMTYVHGQPLSQRIAAAGRLSVAETLSVVAQAGEALHAAHLGGHIHRDVKPANLVVRPDGTVILVDFGVAHSPATASVTTGHLILGTANYMAPEQAAGHVVSPATDIYALGAVAYHCLAGQPPFHGGTALAVVLQHISDEPPRLPPDVPPAVRLLVAQALAKNPADRYPTAAALADAARAAGRHTGAGTAARTRMTAPLARPVPLTPPQPDNTDDTALPAAQRFRGGHLGLAAAVIALLLCIPALTLAFGSTHSANTGPPGPPGTSPPPVSSTAAPVQPAQLTSPRSAAPRPAGHPGTTPPLPSAATPRTEPSTTPPRAAPSSTASPTQATPPRSGGTTSTPVTSAPAESPGPVA